MHGHVDLDEMDGNEVLEEISNFLEQGEIGATVCNKYPGGRDAQERTFHPVIVHKQA